MIIFTYVQLRA